MRKFAKTTDTATQESNAYVFPNQQRTAKSSTQQFAKKETEETGMFSSITAFQGLDPVIPKETKMQEKAALGEGSQVEESTVLNLSNNVATKGKTSDAEAEIELTPDDELVAKLYPLISLRSRLVRWYYQSPSLLEPKTPFTGYDGSVKVLYDTLFGGGNNTKSNAETYLKRLNDKDNPLVFANRYKKMDSDELEAFFKENGGITIIDKLKMDAEECMRMYELLEIRNMMEKYYKVILSRVDEKRTTQDDIDKFIMLNENIQQFKPIYEQCSHIAIKEFYKENYQFALDYISDFSYWMDKLKESKKVNDARKITKGNVNPTIGLEEEALNINYKEAGKPNQTFLKEQNLYNKKNKTYPLYNKGEGDSNEVAMNDVVQGSIGDCYLMSSIASVASKNPAYIQELIKYKEGDSKAVVILYIKDEVTNIRVEKPITVDFRFPVKSTEKKENVMTDDLGMSISTTIEESLPYAKAGDNELWVMLIEKAYAQEMVSYENIKGGNPAEALAVLTGKDSEPKDVSSENKTLEEDLKAAIAGNNVAVAGTIKSPDKSDKVMLDDKTPIFYNHAYSILDVTDGIVKLRNPHGSDTKDEAKVKADSEPQGEPKVETIYVSLDDFRKYFTGFYVNSASK